MKRIKKRDRLQALLLVFVLTTTFVMPNYQRDNEVSAAETKKLVLGSGSIAEGIPSEHTASLSAFPTLENKGRYRFTTDNYDNNNGAFDTNNWGTSAMWDCTQDGTSDKYSGSLYAHPWAVKADSKGVFMAKPPTRTGSTYVVQTLPVSGAYNDFIVTPEFSTSDAKVDAVTDWTYDIVMENSNNANQYLKTSVVMGSPFVFFELKSSRNIDITQVISENDNHVKQTSQIISYNGTTLLNSTMIVIKVYDSIDEANGYPGYDYYAIYVPQGTTWIQSDNSQKAVGKLSAVLPEARTYFSMAWLAEGDSNTEAAAISIANTYKSYAYNFVTDTRADYSYDYDSAILKTTYKYTLDKKADSEADGTIMGIMPHQYKNISNRSYLSNTARTLKGTLKYSIGNSFETEMSYGGVIPWLTSAPDGTKAQLKAYVDEFMENYMPENGNYVLASDIGAGDTYNTGKLLNRSVNVLAAAEAVGDRESSDKILAAMEKELENWFTYSGAGDAQFFAYDEGIGTLCGFPENFDSIKQMNDHHFHYGYFIEAAAQIGLRDSEWLNKYKGVVSQLIDDIACTKRNNANSRYPYLRNFSPYEGNSWASGFEENESGNNQESTSEAMNAWAGIILFGEATGETKYSDLGIYLYRTESEALDNYWFDTDGDNLEETFRNTNTMASLRFCGKYDYATWFSADPACVQGIQLLPVTSTSFYLAHSKEYVEKYISTLKKKGNSGKWNDIWSAYYSLANPTAAMEMWSAGKPEEGESKAHTYHYISTMNNLGTPDTSITSNVALSAVFVKSANDKTYTAYNPTDTVKLITFSDGTQFSANAKTMTVVNTEDLQGEQYFVECYKEDENGNYVLDYRTVEYGDIGERVIVDTSDINGYTFDSANGNNVVSAIISKDRKTTLKFYMKRATYTISYELNGGTNAVGNPVSYKYGTESEIKNPIRSGYTFAGWYTDVGFTNSIGSITKLQYGNLKLYARWRDENSIYVDDDKYITFSNYRLTFSVENNADATQVIGYYKIFNTMSEATQAAESGEIAGFVGNNLTNENGVWSKSIDLSSSAGKYIAFSFNVIKATGSKLSTLRACQIVEGKQTEETETSQEIGTTVSPESKTSEQGTTSAGSSGTYVDFSDITDWILLTNRTDLSYKVIRTQGSGTLGGINPGNGEFFYMPTGFIPESAIIKGPKQSDVYSITSGFGGAEIMLYDSYFKETGYYHVIIKNGDNVLEMAFKRGNPVIVEETTAKETTTNFPTTETPTTEESTTESVIEVKISDDIDITGYQMSASFGGVDGNMGIRVVYQAEPLVEGQSYSEIGVVYGLLYGDTPATTDQMYVGSESKYVASYAATAAGILNVQLGDSPTATYYARTMDVTGFVSEGYTVGYMARTYVKLSDGTYRYSKIHNYTIFDVASNVYDNKLMSSYSAHNYVYDNVLYVVDSNYKKVDFGWPKTIVKPVIINK